MSRKLAVLAMALALVVGGGIQQAKAYDVDQHFYGTYAMARYVGIGHEAAAKIALYAQWPDETTFWGSPMFGEKIRREIHFACNEQGNNLGAMSAFGMWKGGCETIEDHPMAHEIIRQGLEQGSLRRAALGLHTLEDSYAHAGTPSLLGHSMFWHWPDRPFASLDKYNRMATTVMKTLVAFRDSLPPEALDKQVRDPATGSSKPNYQLDAATLAKGYTSNKMVQATVGHDTLKDPEYVRYAMTTLMHEAQDKGYIAKGADVDHWVDSVKLDGTKDGWAAFAELAANASAYEKATGATVFTEKLLKTAGVPNWRKMSKEQYMREMAGIGGPAKAIHSVLKEVIANRIPEPLTDHHKVETEQEDGIREKEMEIRVRNMRNLITSLYGIDVRFSPHELSKYNPLKGEQMPKPKREGEVVVSMDYNEQAAFRTILRGFEFPNTFSAGATGDGSCERCSLIQRSGFPDGSLYDFAYDFARGRIHAKEGNQDYRDPKNFVEMRKDGEIKDLLTPTELAALKKADSQDRGLAADGSGVLYPKQEAKKD